MLTFALNVQNRDGLSNCHFRMNGCGGTKVDSGYCLHANTSTSTEGCPWWSRNTTKSGPFLTFWVASWEAHTRHFCCLWTYDRCHEEKHLCNGLVVSWTFSSFHETARLLQRTTGRQILFRQEYLSDIFSNMNKVSLSLKDNNWQYL